MYPLEFTCKDNGVNRFSIRAITAFIYGFMRSTAHNHLRAKTRVSFLPEATAHYVPKAQQSSHVLLLERAQLLLILQSRFG